jgi:hypothetical protein
MKHALRRVAFTREGLLLERGAQRGNALSLGHVGKAIV